MRIVADENIPLLEAFCGGLGTLTRVDGRSLRREQLVDADVLLVRSVTRVDQALLAGTSVRFVGTATIGTDHVDTCWLDRQGIAFASAPGCNAASVVQYVLSVLSLFLVRQRWARTSISREIWRSRSRWNNPAARANWMAFGVS